MTDKKYNYEVRQVTAEDALKIQKDFGVIELHRVTPRGSPDRSPYPIAKGLKLYGLWAVDEVNDCYLMKATNTLPDVSEYYIYYSNGKTCVLKQMEPLQFKAVDGSLRPIDIDECQKEGIISAFSVYGRVGNGRDISAHIRFLDDSTKL